jgi:hypothetical protein
LLALGALFLLPGLVEAQSRRDRGSDDNRVRTIRLSYERRDRLPDREVQMSVGALRSEDDDKQLPMAAMRIDWRLRRWLRSEVGLSYAIGTFNPAGTGASPAPSRALQLGSATVGLRAELPAPFVRPYVGVAVGLAYRNEENGDPFTRTMMAFPAGVRVPLSNRVALRAEARFRFDQRRNGGEAIGVEQTGGLSVAF